MLRLLSVAGMIALSGANVCTDHANLAPMTGDTCSECFRVETNACAPCELHTNFAWTRPAGDDPTGPDTVCELFLQTRNGDDYYAINGANPSGLLSCESLGYVSPTDFDECRRAMLHWATEADPADPPSRQGMYSFSSIADFDGPSTPPSAGEMPSGGCLISNTFYDGTHTDAFYLYDRVGEINTGLPSSSLQWDQICIKPPPCEEYLCGTTCVSSCSECPDFPTNPASGNVCEAPSGRCGMRTDILEAIKLGGDTSDYSKCFEYQTYTTHQGFATDRTFQHFKYCSGFETQGQCEAGFLSGTLREGNNYDLFIRVKDPNELDPSASCCQWFAGETPAWEQEGECLRTGCTEAELEDPFILMLGKTADWDGGCGSGFPGWELGGSKLCLSQTECLVDSPSCLAWDGPDCPLGQWLNNGQCTEHTSLAGCHASRQVAGTATSDAYCSACSGGWAPTDADECRPHTVCGNQIGGSPRLEGASSTSAGECAECTEGFAVGNESCEPWVECSGNFELQSPSPTRNRVCGLDEEAFSAFDMGTFVGEEKKERLKIAYRLVGKTNAQREKIAKGDFTELNAGEIKSTLKGTSEFTFDLVGGKGYKKPNTETPPTSTEGWELSAGNRQFRTVKSGEKAHVFWEGQWIEHLFSARRRLVRESCDSTPLECPGDEGEVCEFEENTLSGCTMEGLCPANHYCPVFDEIIACPANHESPQGTTSLEGCTECAGASQPGQACGDCVESGTWKCVDGKNVRDCQLLSVEMQINGCCTGECDVNTEGCC